MNSRVHCCAGSSPRVRGTLGHGGERADRSRFIPACAGNASLLAAHAALVAVHPRVCGERGIYWIWQGAITGSSPRVRGTRRRSSKPDPHRRFIPACAGNASTNSPSGGLVKVHPRVCGERTKTEFAKWTKAGSSPRVRGTRTEDLTKAKGVRFIPACAGNAAQYRDITIPCAVHPRVCGERRYGEKLKCLWGGSSPRVRGTPALHDLQRLLERFIPACAGNASPS